MTSPTNGVQPYRIEMSGVIRDQILRLQRQASEDGRGLAYIKAMESVLGKISHQAKSAGETLYSLPALRLKVRLIGDGPLIIHYAVSEDRPTVYIKAVILLP